MSVKFVWFNLMPWPDLPDDFREKHRSVWVDIPSSLFDPEQQIIMTLPAACSSPVRMRSRWSGVPSMTLVSQVPHTPSMHE